MTPRTTADLEPEEVEINGNRALGVRAKFSVFGFSSSTKVPSNSTTTTATQNQPESEVLQTDGDHEIRQKSLGSITADATAAPPQIVLRDISGTDNDNDGGGSHRITANSTESTDHAPLLTPSLFDSAASNAEPVGVYSISMDDDELLNQGFGFFDE